jgi:hypothetical protein
MRKYIIIGAIAVCVLILAGIVFFNHEEAKTVVYKGDFANPGSATDIRTITAVYSKTDSEANDKLEEQVGTLYRNIKADKSEKAVRTIGEIEGRKISAKELELRALSYQVFGSKNPYKDAWNAMKINIYEARLAHKYDLDVDNEARHDIDLTREDMTKEPGEKEEIGRISKAYGLSEADYWDVLQFQRMKHLVVHNALSDYLSSHDLPAVDPKSISSKVTDQEYIDKIGAAR